MRLGNRNYRTPYGHSPQAVISTAMAQKTYTVSDGDLVLTLEGLPKEDSGGYGFTPLTPQSNTPLHHPLR